MIRRCVNIITLVLNSDHVDFVEGLEVADIVEQVSMVTILDPLVNQQGNLPCQLAVRGQWRAVRK